MTWLGSWSRWFQLFAIVGFLHLFTYIVNRIIEAKRRKP